jgi:hypothetical protein
LRPSGLLLYRGQGKQGPAPSFGGRHAWRRQRWRTHRRWRDGAALDTALGCVSAAPPPSSGLTRTHARTARRPAHSTPATARGATSRPGARASPRCGQSHGALGCGRLGFKRTVACKNTPSARGPAHHSTERGVELLHTELRWWRGQGHGAHGCGRPAPALTSTCNRKTPGTKAGSRQGDTRHRGGSPRDATRRKGRSCTTGWRRVARSA